MRHPAGFAWVGFALLALACKGDLITPVLLPPPGVTPTPSPALALRIGASDADAITAEVLDAAGNIYVAGTFSGTVQVNPASIASAITSLGAADGFVAKFSPTGSLLWAVRFGGAGEETVNALTRDTAGNLYVAGGFEGTALFGNGSGTPTLFSEGTRDGFVAKLGADGAFLWARRFGGTGTDEVGDVAADAAGNVYAVGGLTGNADALPAVGGAVIGNGGDSDGFALSFDPSGTVRWAFAVGGTQADLASSVRVTTGGTVVVAGTFQGISDFAPGAAVSSLTSLGESDVFLAGYSAAGALLWARGFGGPQEELLAPGALAAEANGGVALTGAFSGSVDFDPGPAVNARTSIGLLDVFVARLDGNGTFESVFSVGAAGGTGLVLASHLSFGSDGNLLATGAFSGTVDFDPGLGARSLTSVGTAGGTDAFVAKYTPQGAPIWVSRFGDPATGAGHLNIGLSVASDAAGAVYVGGQFFASPSFDPAGGTFHLNSLGGSDGFLVKLTGDGALALR